VLVGIDELGSAGRAVIRQLDAFVAQRGKEEESRRLVVEGRDASRRRHDAWLDDVEACLVELEHSVRGASVRLSRFGGRDHATHVYRAVAMAVLTRLLRGHEHGEGYRGEVLGLLEA